MQSQLLKETSMFIEIYLTELPLGFEIIEKFIVLHEYFQFNNTKKLILIKVLGRHPRIISLPLF